MYVASGEQLRTECGQVKIGDGTVVECCIATMICVRGIVWV